MKNKSQKIREELFLRLREEAERRRVTAPELVREVLVARIEESKRSCFELAKDLVGSVKGLPEDIAVNPKHLDGFGS